MTESRRDVCWLVAGALAVKGIVLFQLGSHPLLQPQGDLDTARYVELAQRIAAGGPLAIHEPFFLSPLYVYILAAIFKAGGGLLAARVVQICLGGMVVAFVYLLAFEWFDRRVARLAALLVLLAGFLTFSEILILQSALDPVLVAASLYFVARTQSTKSRASLVAAGLALGLLALNRPNALGYAVVAVLLIGAASRRTSAALVVLASLATVIGLNAFRNYAASGEVVFISSHGGLNFYIGNNPHADGIYHPVPGVTPSITGQVDDATRLAEAEEGRRLSPSEVSRYFYVRAFEWMAGNPTNAAMLFLRKLAVLVNRTEVPLNYSYAFYRHDEPTLLRWLVATSMVLLPLGLIGVCLGPHSLRYWTWASFVPIYGLSVAAFFVSDRYRLPLLVPLAILSARALVRITDALRERRFAGVAVPLAGALAIAALGGLDLGLDDGLGGERARKATWLIEQGSYDEARRYASAGEGLKYPGVFHFRVGQAFMRAHQYNDAEKELRAALAFDRGQPAIELALGQAVLLGGRAVEAVALLRAALDAQFRPEVSGPWLIRACAAAGKRAEAVDAIAHMPELTVRRSGVETQVEIGSLALELDAPAPAERWLRPAVDAAPASADAREKLAVSLLLQGRSGEALPHLVQASRLAPSNASVRLNLAVAYAELGRLDEARAAARDSVRLDPSEPRARALLQRLSRER